MNAIWLTEKERKLLHNALNVYIVDMMKQINDSYIIVDPDKAVDIREKLYDNIDQSDDMLRRLEFYD